MQLFLQEVPMKEEAHKFHPYLSQLKKAIHTKFSILFSNSTSLLSFSFRHSFRSFVGSFFGLDTRADFLDMAIMFNTVYISNVSRTGA